MTTHHIASCTALGTMERLDAEAQRRGASWLKGKQLAKDLAAACQAISP